MNISHRLRQVGRLAFKRESNLYKLGASAYHGLRPVLLRLSLDERTGLDNAMQLAAIARASTTCRPRAGGKRIVFLTVRGWPIHLATEAMLAARLRQMGHDVSFWICADSFSFCLFTSINSPEQEQHNCIGCGHSKALAPGSYFDNIHLHCPEEAKRAIQASVARLAIEECRTFEYDTFPYGDLVHPGIVWFLRRTRLTEKDTPIYRKALVSGHATRVALEQLVADQRPDTVVMLNGDFNIEHVAGYAFKRLGIRFVTHDYTFHERLGVAADRPVWDDLTFCDESRGHPPAITAEEQFQAKKLLRQWRRTGGYQGHLFWSNKSLHQNSSVRSEIGLDERPLAVAYTNLTFESSVVGKDRAFKDQFDWISALIKWFADRPAWQLAVRIHPAEVRADQWRPNESLYDFIRTQVSARPENVRVVRPDETISSYTLGSLARVILVYSSTLGLEMAERRKRVITAAHTHYAGRGFTSDPLTADEYFVALQQNMESDSMLCESARAALVNYVGWFMFRRLAPFEPLSGIHEDWPQLNVKRLADLADSNLAGFQRICRFIADGTRWW
jgi:hypothetical protein